MDILEFIHKVYFRTICGTLDKIVQKVINKWYPQKFEKYNINCYEKRNVHPRIIVSLTTFPKRIETVHYVIESILMQSIIPDKIILCLIKNEYPENYELPESLTKLLSDRFEIVWGDENLRPHNKYFYTMQKYPDDIIITVDDDGFYRKNLIKKLLKSYNRYPKAVSCIRAHRMKFAKDGSVLPYNKWDYETLTFNKPSHKLLATGVGGVLYPPHALDKRAFDKERIKKLCWKADDIWLKVMEILNDTPVVVVPSIYKYVIAINHAEEGANLMTDNVQNNRNDVYLKQVCDYYHVSLIDC